MAVSQAKIANSLRDIATLLEREEVRPALLKEVEEFINKFPWAEFSTCPEDKLLRCPPEIMEQILQYLPPRDLKSAVLVNKTLCGVGGKLKFWGDVKVSLQSLEFGVSFMESSRELSCLEASKGPGTLNGVVKLWMSCVFLILPGLQMNSKADHNPHAN